MVGWTKVSFSVHFYNKVKIKPVSYIISSDNKSGRSDEKTNLVQGLSLRRIIGGWFGTLNNVGIAFGFSFFQPSARCVSN